ncbi:MAG: hypothetical protein QOG73_487, partial [Acetobacteraceae bacterium]|nr:hypothetical protein [Acetobacteraceae bacterium]
MVASWSSNRLVAISPPRTRRFRALLDLSRGAMERPDGGVPRGSAGLEDGVNVAISDDDVRTRG